MWMRGPRLNLRVDDEAVAACASPAGIPYSEVDNGHPGQVIPFRPTSPKTNKQDAAGEARTPQEPQPVWKRRLSLITSAVKADPLAEADSWPSGLEILYRVDPEASLTSGKPTVEICYRERTMKGEWEDQIATYSHECDSTLRDSADQQY